MTTERLHEVMKAVQATGADLNTFRGQVVAAGWAIQTSKGREELGDLGKMFVYLTHNPDKIKSAVANQAAPAVNI